jgi:hypothetical protein
MGDGGPAYLLDSEVDHFGGFFLLMPERRGFCEGEEKGKRKKSKAENDTQVTGPRASST